MNQDKCVCRFKEKEFGKVIKKYVLMNKESVFDFQKKMVSKDKNNCFGCKEKMC